MAKLKDLKVSIGLSGDNKSKLDAGLKGVQQQFKTGMGKVQAGLRTAGIAMTAAITAPLVAMAAKAVQAFDQQAKAIAQVEAGLKSTGNQVGYTSKQLQQLASNLQNKTLFGDEEILKDATAQLLTFTNIAGENFQKTQAIALDLATRLDGDLKGASIMLGKALNDPVANLSALSRAGIQFSAEQKEVIKSMAETGRMGEAQALILEELEKQYGGSAQAAAKAGMGPFKQLSNSLGDLQEQFGKLILEFITPMVPKIRSVMDAFLNLSSSAKRNILLIAGALGAAGPIALAVSALIPVIGALISPVGLVAAAVVALAYLVIDNFAQIEKAIVPVINKVIVFQNKTKGLSILAELVGNAYVQGFKNVLAAAKMVMRSIDGIGQALMHTADLDFSKAKDALADVYAENLDTIIERSKETGASILDAINRGMQAEDLEFVKVGQLSARVVEFKNQLKSMFSASGPGGAVEVAVTPTAKAAAAATTGLLISSDAAAQTTSAVSRMNDMVAVSVDLAGQASAAFVGLGEALAGMATGTMNVGQFMASVLTSLADLLGQIGQQFIAAGIAAAQFYANLIANPFAAVAAGVALVAASGIIKALGSKLANNEVPQMAEGGLFTGASLAMVGEGPGTSLANPEVVAPLDKLQQMMGGGNVTVTGRLDGRDILISSERAGFDRNRVRGF